MQLSKRISHENRIDFLPGRACPARRLCDAERRARGHASGVLTNADGMTLYVFDKDAAGSGKSACNGDCAMNWPPLMATSGNKADGDYSIITRDDGSRQWAYKGKPLYRWSEDQQPGDMTGDGVTNV